MHQGVQQNVHKQQHQQPSSKLHANSSLGPDLLIVILTYGLIKVKQCGLNRPMEEELRIESSFPSKIADGDDRLSRDGDAVVPALEIKGHID